MVTPVSRLRVKNAGEDRPLSQSVAASQFRSHGVSYQYWEPVEMDEQVVELSGMHRSLLVKLTLASALAEYMAVDFSPYSIRSSVPPRTYGVSSAALRLRP